MGIADARAMYPLIEIIEADPEADRRLIEALADWCDRYTPLVALDGSNGLFLDISGCASLFGGERAMMDDIVSRFFNQGFDVCAGLASTPGAAWAAARFSPSPRIIDQNEEMHFLDSLPLAALRIDPDIRAGLESVGLRSIGSLKTTPRAPLTRRFGKMPLLRFDQAVGRIEEAISPRMPVPPLSVERHLVDPIGELDDIERLVLLLASSLRQDLERRDEGAKALELLLFRVDGMVSRISVGASVPMREPRSIGKLFHERLATLETSIDAGYGFDLVRLSVLSTAHFEKRQADLAGETETDAEDVAMFADRVRARLGRDAILRPKIIESHLPERAALLVPFDRELPEKIGAVGVAGENSARKPQHLERPQRLFSHPEPIDVPATEVPEGAPHHFRWRRALHQVARSEGPERISPEWWRQKETAETRDYFRVEDTDGRRYWLYREGLYGASKTNPRWYMHGLSA